MSSILSSTRPSSRSSSRPRTNMHGMESDPSKMSPPPPVPSASTLHPAATHDRRPSSSIHERAERSPVRIVPAASSRSSHLPSQISSPSKSSSPPKTIVASVPLKIPPSSHPAKPSPSSDRAPLSQTTAPKSLGTKTNLTQTAQATSVKSSFEPTVTSSPANPTNKSAAPAHSPQAARSSSISKPVSKIFPQKTVSPPHPSRNASRSPSRPSKSSLITTLPTITSPPPSSDPLIPNLPADRPIRGTDPVFAVAERMNEEIPIGKPYEIRRMSTRTEICANTGGAIGNTPLVLLNSVGKGLPGKIAVKLEYMNPAGSVKDRVGYAMIEDAEKRGLITPGKTVLIEATSGNMGIALAFVARIKGYKLILCMPASMSVERRSLLKAYGAEVVLTDPATAVKGALQRAKELQAAIPHAHILNQFGNPANVMAHYHTTGPEVWEQTQGKVDIVCYGVGSGGTLSGVGKYLKEKKPSVEVYPVEPFESSVINGLAHSPHKIQGMGTGFIPEILDKTLFSEALRVHSDDAIAMAKRLATEEAILGGISSGANVCAAIQLASRPENEGKLIVTNINSFGERYLSTTLYSEIRDAAEKMKMMSLDESLNIAQKYVGKE